MSEGRDDFELVEGPELDIPDGGKKPQWETTSEEADEATVQAFAEPAKSPPDGGKKPPY